MENVWIRIIALLMALFLWFHVATDKVYKYRLALPISDIALGERLTLANEPPDSMTVVVSATGKQLLRRKWRGRGMRILATQLSIGRHTVNLSTANTLLAGAGSFVTLDEVVSPVSLLLNVDYITETRVKVMANITVIADEGFAVNRISKPDPPEVKLIGARSRVRMITAVSTESKELTCLRDNLTMTLPLAKPVGYHLLLEPDSVTVSIEVVAVKTRVFEDIPIVVYNAPVNKEVSTEPSVLRIELTGPPNDIDLLDSNALVASVDYRGRDAGGVCHVKIDCPSNFKVKRSSASTVRIVEE